MKRLRCAHRHGSLAPDLPPALVVQPGETFRMEPASLLTLYPDGQIPPRYEAISIPVTGPVFVQGAARGAVLRVSIHSIDLPSNRGVVMTLPGLGVMGGETTAFSTRVVR